MFESLNSSVLPMCCAWAQFWLLLRQYQEQKGQVHLAVTWHGLQLCIFHPLTKNWCSGVAVTNSELPPTSQIKSSAAVLGDNSLHVFDISCGLKHWLPLSHTLLKRVNIQNSLGKQRALPPEQRAGLLTVWCSQDYVFFWG